MTKLIRVEKCKGGCPHYGMYNHGQGCDHRGFKGIRWFKGKDFVDFVDGFPEWCPLYDYPYPEMCYKWQGCPICESPAGGGEKKTLTSNQASDKIHH